MKRFPLLAVLFLLLIPANALANPANPDTNLPLGPIGEISIFYQPSTSIRSFGLYSPLLGPQFPIGTFTNFVTSVMCGNAACTTLSAGISISELTLTDVLFEGTIYPTLYLSGSFSVGGTLFRSGGLCFGSGTCFQGPTSFSGLLTACSDPACTMQLFQLRADNRKAEGIVSVTFNSEGKPVLQSEFFVLPEPATLVLFGTGLAGIGWRKYRGSKI